MPHAVLRLCLLLAVALAVAPPRAAEPVDDGAIGVLTEAVRQAPALTEEARAPLLVSLQEARAALDSAKAFAAAAAEYDDALANGKAQIADFEARTAAAESEPVDLDALVGSTPTLEELEATIADLEAEQRARQARRATLLQTMDDTEAQEAAARDRLVAVKSAMEQLAPVAPPAEDTLAAKVAAVTAQARLQALRAEEALLQSRLRGGGALAGVRAARSAYLDAASERAKAELALLRSEASRRRADRVEAELSATQSRTQALAATRPELAAYAERNLSLLEEQRLRSAEIEATRADMATLRAQLAAVEEDAALTRRRLEVAGLESELGQVMLKRLTSLPETQELMASASARNALIADVSVATIQHDEDLRELEKRRDYVAARFPDFADWSAEAQTAFDKLFRQRRELLRDTLRDENTLLRLLVDGNEAAEALAGAVREYEAFLTGNLLWISNFNYADVGRLLSQLATLTAPDGFLALWQRGPRALAQPAPLALLLLLVVLLALRPRLRRAQAQELGRPIRPRDESARLILHGILLQAALALPGPLLVLAAGLLLRAAGSDSAQLSALGDGLVWGALLYFALGLLSRLSGRFGSGRRLLKWNGQKIDALRRDLPWAGPLLVAAQTLSVAANHLSPNDSGGSLGALGTFVIAATLLLLSLRALRSGAFSGDWLARLLLQAAAVIAAVIAVMHLTGHLFAAHLYLRALGLSVVAVILALLVTNILQRVLLIYRARLERRAREEPDGEEEAEEPENLEVVASLSDAHTQLLGLARLAALALPLWFLWSPALPALRVLNEIELWKAADAALPEGELRSVSLGTLLVAAIVIAVTVLVTRHLPPLVKVLLMEWGKAGVGARYATGVILQYLIIGIGASTSLSMLGWNWSKLQWLVAALGVGIGFGLQEIVANFISGLILLFERPIRPGDIISVGGNDGVVAKINPRATVIESFEGKELMIPNKDLITGTVINWSLTSSKLRVVVPVGVAYGSDVEAAMRILVEVARDNPLVLEEPEPLTTFEDFGDNALTLWLRCFAERDYIRVWTALRTEIYKRFNAAGIAIAFPQRDVHLDAQTPIPVTVIGNSAATDN